MTYKVSELVEDGSSLVVVVISAGRGELGEVPEAVVGARNDDVVAGDGAIQTNKVSSC